MSTIITGQPASSLSLSGNSRYVPVTLTQIVAQTDNYAIGNGSWFRISSDTPGRKVTGIAGGTSGRMIIFTNTDTSYIEFRHEDSSSTSANRIHFDSGASALKLQADSSCVFLYDNSISRWRGMWDVSSARDYLIGGAWTFDTHDVIFGNGLPNPGEPGATGFIHGARIADDTYFISSTGGGALAGFDLSGGSGGVTATMVMSPSANRTYTWPNSNLTVVGTSTTQTLTNKTIDPINDINVNPGTGPVYHDSASTTKQMVMDLTQITAGTTRTWQSVNISGRVSESGTESVAAGGTATAGKLGFTNFSTNAAGATTCTLGNTLPAGQYRLLFYLVVTSGGAASTLAMTVTWNDGAARTQTVITAASSAAAGVVGGLGVGNNQVSIYSAASQNISFTVTEAGATPPTYSIFASLEAL